MERRIAVAGRRKPQPNKGKKKVNTPQKRKTENRGPKRKKFQTRPTFGAVVPGGVGLIPRGPLPTDQIHTAVRGEEAQSLSHQPQPSRDHDCEVWEEETCDQRLGSLRRLRCFIGLGS